MLNWIVWNTTDYSYKNEFGIKWPTRVDLPWIPNKQTTTTPADWARKQYLSATYIEHLIIQQP